MKRFVPLFVVALLVLALGASTADAQVKWMVGGRLGLSLGTLSISTPANIYGFAPAANTSSTSAGLQIGPTVEVIFGKQFAICEDFNINTEGGTPIEWTSAFKAYFPISGSQIKPYADGGFGLLFVTGGPFFGVKAGGGALFPISNNLYIPADLQLGLYFGNGATLFWLAGTTGIRYVF
jgi:hypothetical protein